MLNQLQQQLNQTYRVGHGYDVCDFLITDPTLARFLGGDSLLRNTSESLLVAQGDEDLELSLFLDADLLGRLESTDPLNRLHSHQLDDFWQVLEGVSHFNCVAWKATKERACTLLELELQAEIDKFVTTMQLALEQGRGEMSRRVHGWLFDDVGFREELDEEQTDRYRTANDYAGRYCRGLHQRLLDEDREVLSELRRFFRLQLNDKIGYIRERAWAVS